MNPFLNLLKYPLRYGNLLPRQSVSGYLEWTMLRSVLRDYSVDCVLDVGANCGHYARNLRRVGYTGYICSFEPIPEDFVRMSTTLQGDRRWFGYNYALGSADEQRTFHVAIESTAMSSFLTPLDGDWILREITVEMRRLDSIFPQLVRDTGLSTPCTFLKMDTQGLDLEVVGGATSSVSQIVGLQSEISSVATYSGMPHYLDALRVYEDLGFELFNLAEVAREPYNGRIIEMNCVMMRPECRHR